jgi:hypothetical protein
MSTTEQGWTPPRCYEGATVFVIGGGPSLPVDEIVNRLPGWPVVAVNDAYKLGQWPYVYFSDLRWWEIHREALLKYPGDKVSSNACVKGVPGCHFVRRITNRAWTAEPDAVGWGHCSGIGALCLAVKLGASRVVLLGFDLKKDQWERDNWHLPSNPRRPFIKPERYVDFQDGFARWKQEFADDVAKKRCPPATIINATPGSAMTTFPVVDWRVELPPESR